MNFWNNLTWQQLGLAWFMFVSGGIWIVLAYDEWLNLSGRRMITDYCRANPGIGWAIGIVLCSAVMGFMVHIMAIVKVDPDELRRLGR